MNLFDKYKIFQFHFISLRFGECVERVEKKKKIEESQCENKEEQFSDISREYHRMMGDWHFSLLMLIYAHHTQHHTTDRNQSRRNKQSVSHNSKHCLTISFSCMLAALWKYISENLQWISKSLTYRKENFNFVFYPVRKFHNSSQWISRLGLSCRLIEYKKNYKFLIGDVSSQLATQRTEVWGRKKTSWLVELTTNTQLHYTTQFNLLQAQRGAVSSSTACRRLQREFLDLKLDLDYEIAGRYVEWNMWLGAPWYEFRQLRAALKIFVKCV